MRRGGFAAGRRLRGAASGVLAAAMGVAVAELVAAGVRPRSSPLLAIGGTVVDAVPTPVKEFAVRTGLAQRTGDGRLSRRPPGTVSRDGGQRRKTD